MTTPATLLVVDDDPTLVEVIETVLRDGGHRVVTARDGREALEMAHAEIPDLIVTDILMPNLDGYQLCRAVKADPRLFAVPVVFYTATYTDEEDRELALSLGASRFLVKPASPEAILRAVGEALEEARHAGAPRPAGGEDDETGYLRRYNRRLISKLEDKLEELDSSNRRLRREVERAHAAEAEVRRLAYEDPLTGLPNRARMLQRLEEVFEETRQRSAVLVLDLDSFREVNHTLGHHKGDLLLRLLAERLAKVPASAVDLLAHLGGDEFALLLLEVEGEGQALEMARRLTSVVEPVVDLEGLSVSVTASVGISLYPDHGTGGAALLRQAEIAMFSAKGRRGSVSVYSPDRDPYRPERLRRITGLRRAIGNEEMVLHYQPKIELSGKHVVGVEALIRWNHPEHGLLLPDTFVALAEQTGQIVSLTRWILRAGLQEYRRFEEEGLALRLSLNLSARSLVDELPAELEALLAELEIDSPRLTFEITESVLLQDPRRAAIMLQRLAEMGVEIAIDDFGTGYSSLSHLKQLPVRELKIDKSFVINLLEDDNDAVIVRSTIDLAHNLGVRVTAEGVETEAVLNRLWELGCDMAQGYYLARPMDAGSLRRWLRGKTPGANGT